MWGSHRCHSEPRSLCTAFSLPSVSSAMLFRCLPGGISALYPLNCQPSGYTLPGPVLPPSRASTIPSTVPKKSNRQLSAFSRLHRRINRRIRSKVKDTGHLKTTSAAIPSQIPSGICQSDLGRALEGHTLKSGLSGAPCTACRSRGGRKTAAILHRDAALARPAIRAAARDGLARGHLGSPPPPDTPSSLHK